MTKYVNFFGKLSQGKFCSWINNTVYMVFALQTADWDSVTGIQSLVPQNVSWILVGVIPEHRSKT